MVKLGRDQRNRIVVNHPRVSRLHARLELRKGKFILSDQSTNGTYVYQVDHKMVLLRQDEIILDGEGYISLGQAAAPDSDLAIYFHSL